MSGRLYVCATPIGNLEDVSARLIRVLGEVSVVAAEDTRRTRKLLSHHQIHSRLVSYHDGNELSETPKLIRQLASGDDIALVSDSGMPGIADPGYRLIGACLEAGIEVRVIPGPTAPITALIASGLPTSRFAFEGFLSRKQGERRRRLEAIADDDRTTIFFEAPSRLAGTLQDLLDVFGDRRAAVAREMTKIHEEFVRGSLSELLLAFADGETKGEIVVVVEGAQRAPGDFEDAVSYARELVDGGAGKSQASAKAAKRFRIPRSRIYKRLVEED